VTTTAGRRSRVVSQLPGQLSLDLPGIPTIDQLAEQAAELAAARTSRRRPVPGEGMGEPRPRRLLPTRGVDVSGTAQAARVPVAVWAVWDEEDLVGVYAEESTARADAAVLARDAVRSGRRASIIDCLPLQVFTETQHGNRPRPGAGWPGRGTGGFDRR